MTELEEFNLLSHKVAERGASGEELQRWRELRARLAPQPPPPPPRAPSPTQRQHVRGTRKLRVGFAPARQLQVTFTDEVGAGGLRLTVHEAMEDGALVLLRLELAGANDPHPLFAVGRVVWSKREGGHFQIGLEFVDLRPQDRERLEAYALAHKTG